MLTASTGWMTPWKICFMSIMGHVCLYLTLNGSWVVGP